MTETTRSFPNKFIEQGLEKIIQAFPDRLIVPKIAELGSGSGRVGLAAWKYYYDKTGSEPELILVDNDSEWFVGSSNQQITNRDTLEKACLELGLPDVPHSVNYKVVDLIGYLSCTKNRHGLVLMRSVLQFIDKSPYQVFKNIADSVYPGGSFIHACFCCPDEESKLFYRKMTEYYLSIATKSKFKRKALTMQDILSSTVNYFQSVKVRGSYNLDLDPKYVIERFGISIDQANEFGRIVLPNILRQYPKAKSSLNIKIGDDFRIDIPYFVIKAEKS